MPDAPPAPDPEARTRPFADVLRELDKGRVHTELSDKLQELIVAVQDVRKGGTIQLTIKVDSAKADGMVEVSANVATKTPRRARTSVFFVDDEHNLHRNDPRQLVVPGLAAVGDADTTRSAAR